MTLSSAPVSSCLPHLGKNLAWETKGRGGKVGGRSRRRSNVELSYHQKKEVSNKEVEED